MSLLKIARLVPLVFLISCQSAEESNRGVEIADGKPLDAAAFGSFQALVIGINAYQYWPKLSFAESDAADIRQILISEYGFVPENVVSLLGSQATESNIVAFLKDLLNRSTEKDNLLVYYAGHGQLDPLTETGHWIPVDGQLYDESSWVPLSIIKTLVTASRVKAKSVLVITDSCYGGALTRSGPSPGKVNPTDASYLNALHRIVSKRSRQTMASGGFEQVPDKSHFAELLKSALRMNAYPVVDMEYIFYTQVFPHLRLAGQQYPVMARWVTGPADDGQFLLLKHGKPPQFPTGPDAPPEQTEPRSPDDNLKAQADMEFWDAIKASSDPELFEAYLQQFPGGIFEVIAKKRIEDLRTDERRPRVPKLVGMDLRSASRILLDLGFKQGSVTERASGNAQGIVLSQSLEPETEATAGAAIDLVIAKSVALIKLPAFIGMGREAVAAALAKYGLNVGKISYVSMSRVKATKPGIVVGQSPEAGVEVRPQSSVNLSISQGDLVVPNLSGMKEKDAIATLRKNGLNPGVFRKMSSKEQTGTVVGQRPGVGTRVAAGEKVDIWVAAAGAASPLIDGIKTQFSPQGLQVLPDRPTLLARSLPPPRQISPRNGAVLTNFPRETELIWERVDGAAGYVVEVEYQTGSDWKNLLRRKGVTTTRYKFTFKGMQPGRWRVWAVDQDGEDCQKGDWWGFGYAR